MNRGVNSPKRDDRDIAIDPVTDRYYFNKLPKAIRDCVNYSPERYGCKEIYEYWSTGQMSTDEIVRQFLNMHPEIVRELKFNERVRRGN